MKTSKNKKSLSKVAALIIALLGFTSFRIEAASTFGFNYWPWGYSSDVLTNRNWTLANRNAIQADLDHMSSLGAGVIRLVFLPQLSGYQLVANGGTFTSDFTEERNNLVTFLGYCSSRGLKVIICFGNNYYGLGDPPRCERFWICSYGNTTDGFTNFLGDTLTWINGFVGTIENSPYHGTVLYYDYESEYRRDDPYSDWYITTLHTYSSIPSGKRGCSIFKVDLTAPSTDDVQYLRDVLGANALDFVDYHSYPTYGVNSNVEACYDSVKSRFPNATVLVGEFGRESSGGEVNQQTTVKDIATRARNKNIPYHLHWMYTDNVFAPNTWGWAYSRHDPKNVMGGMSVLNNTVSNPDTEIVANGQPSGWSAGSTGNISFLSGGPSSTDAATNNYYARIQCNTANAAVWMNAPTITVPTGTTPKLYLNCFFRSSMTNIQVAVSEFTSTGTPNGKTFGPAYTPTGWSWNNYLVRGGSWSRQLNANTRYVIVSVQGIGAATSPSYLDVDTISAYMR
jgi:hypothetical protein